MTSSGDPYELQWELEVLDQIRALPREVQRAVIHRCGELRDEPRPSGFEKLEASYRISYADVLIWYWVDDANRFVIIVRVSRDPAG